MNSDENKRVILKNNEARQAIKNAIKEVGEIVSATLGPSGQNVILDRARRDRAPLITNDGVSIADEIRMENECEDLVVQTIIETAKRTNDEAGDGTTTSITIAKQLVDDCFEKIGESDLNIGNENPMEISNKLSKEAEIVVKELKEMTTPVDTLEKLKEVTFSAMESKEIGDIVAEAVWEVGKDGYTTQEDGYNGIMEKEIVQGMKIYAKYAAPFMVTNDKRQSVYTEAPILVSNITFNTLGQVQNLFADMAKVVPNKHNAIVIIGSKFEAQAIKQAWGIFNQTKEKNPFRILLVKAPSLTDDELEDVAAYLDATFINGDTKIGMKTEDAKYKDLGFCKKIIVGDDETILMGGRGLDKNMMANEPDVEIINRVQARLAVIKEHLKVEVDEVYKKKMERRIGILSGGIAIIKVGAKTDTERSYLRLKVEDAINSAKASLQEGVVKGGGLALKEIGEKHPDFMVANALRAPYDQIQKNAGGDFKIEDGIVDPVKVTRAAFENAISVARILITTNTIIAEKRESMVEQLKELTQN